MDGLLVIDKPSGPTSHDVVARVRRALGEPRVGHTGTLDPLATGVLPLVVGRATRLAQFLSAADKQYDAVIQLGVGTDTDDAAGRAIGEPFEGALPSRHEIERALASFTETFLQQPPAFSAKKIDGERSYRLARKAAATQRGTAAAPGPPAERELPAAPVLPAPVSVTVYALELVALDGASVSLRVTCSAGFYVRGLARDLGSALGTGAHLTALRRTRSGSTTLADAVGLEDVERNPEEASRRAVPMRGLLLDLPWAVLTETGCARAGHGRELASADFARREGDGPRVRLLDASGELVGIAEPGTSPSLLHPSIVLR